MLPRCKSSITLALILAFMSTGCASVVPAPKVVCGNAAADSALVTFLRQRRVNISVAKDGNLLIESTSRSHAAIIDYLAALDVKLSVIRANIANARTTVDSAKTNNPYRRQIVVILPTGSVLVRDDPTPLVKSYEPADPFADANGYLLLPNVDLAIERANADGVEKERAGLNAALRDLPA